MSKMPLPIVASLAVLIVASLGCYLQAPATITPSPEPDATITGTSEPGPLLGTFTVTAQALNIRDEDLDSTGEYFSQGKQITCRLQPDGWCILENATINSGSSGTPEPDSGIQQVWSGCLNPNPQSRGCRAR